MKEYYVYILANKRGALYTGVTSDLERRVYEHKNKIFEGFTKKYNIDRIVYYETTNDINAAITREKQIKGLLRSKKLELIKQMNPRMDDLSESWLEKAVKE
ncbi:MAG: GIY-YIG nuclease family protein [Dehalococcoidales bacterium]|jgi:putative endonuclease